MSLCLQCVVVAVCCSVLQGVAGCCKLINVCRSSEGLFSCSVVVAGSCRVLQGVAGCCRVLQGVAD